MISEYRRNKKTGFSLIEILIALVIFASGIALMSRVFIIGKYYIKASENKSTGMKIASLEMEKYLAYSYAGLEDLITNTCGAASTNCVIPYTVYSGNSNFEWQATLQKKNETNTTTGKSVPYIEIEVICRYSEKDISGTNNLKYVRLANIIPYPYFHIFTTSIDYSTGGGVAPTAPQAGGPSYTPMNTIATLNIQNKIKSQLQVFYTLSIESTGSGIDPTNTVATKCYLDGVGQDIMTVTPISTQPLITNVIGVSTPISVVAGGHTITVRWSKDSGSPGTVTLKSINVIVLVIEPAS